MRAAARGAGSPFSIRSQSSSCSGESGILPAFVSLYGLFAKGSTIAEHLSLAIGVLPAGAVEIIQEQVNRIAAKSDARLSAAFAAT